MFLNYLHSEIMLIYIRWRVLAVNLLYFFVPVFFFKIITASNNNNIAVYNSLFLMLFVIILQFFVFNKVNNENITGINLYKFCIPLKKSYIILADLIAENIFGMFFLVLCLACYALITESLVFANLLICGAILTPASICLAHSYTLMFCAKNKNLVLVTFFAFFAFLPLLFFVSNIAQNINYLQNLISAILYSVFITLFCAVKTALKINNINT